jgi:transposase
VHLRASHIRPWRDSDNEARLDGENGLLLTPTIDHLFDRGFISFEDDGRLLISPVAHPQSWKAYVRRLAEEEGAEDPDDDDARRMDRRRDKRVSNKDWESKSDPEGRITKLKDGRTRLAYKAEHVIDLETEAIVSATIYPADLRDGSTIFESLSESQQNVARAGLDAFAEEAIADEGYHKAEALAECTEWGIRTYIPERRDHQTRRWTDKPKGWREAFHANRRRIRGRRGRALQRLRAERVERSFAHVCRSGNQRRTWLRVERTCRSAISSPPRRGTSDC